MAPDILDFIDTDRHDRSLLPVLDPLLHDILDRLADFVPGGGTTPRSPARTASALSAPGTACRPWSAGACPHPRDRLGPYSQARQSTRRMQYSNTTMQPQSGTNSNRVGLGDPRSLMWTAPEVASPIRAVRARPVAPPISVVSPVRSLLAARPPGVLRHNRAASAQHRALPLSRCLRGRRAGCPATPETGPVGPPKSAPRHPTVAVDCADRQAGGIGQPPAASSVHLRQ